MEAEDPEHFDAALAAAADHSAPVVQHGSDARRNPIRLHVAAPQAGVPFIEIAYICAGDGGVYDYIEQEQQWDKQIPATVDADTVADVPGRTTSTCW